MTYRIAWIKIRDFKILGDVDLKPQGRVTVVTGKPDAGKTSVIDVIASLLGGAKWIPEVPTRRGAMGGYLIAAGIEDENAKPAFTITRTASKKLVQVTPAPGVTLWETNQAMINSIFNDLGLDPLRFIHPDHGWNKPKSEWHVTKLLEYLGVTETLEKIDKEIKDYTDTRVEAGRERDRLRHEAEAIPVQEPLPKDKIDTDEIRARIAAANEENRQLAATIERHAKVSAKLNDAEAAANQNARFLEETAGKIEGLVEQLASLEPLPAMAAAVRDELQSVGAKAERLKGAPSAVISGIDAAQRHMIGYINELGGRQTQFRTQLEQARKAQEAAEESSTQLEQAVVDARAELEAAPMGKMIDVAALVEEQEHANLINREIDRRSRRADLEAKYQAKDQEWNDLTRAIDKCKHQKVMLVTDVKMPIKGLTLHTDNDGKNRVMFDDGKGAVPLEQMGEAKQIEIGISLVLARQPKLRLICIQHGEAMDDASIERLAKFAEEQDFYVWMAKVDTSGEVGIYLEDGAVKAVNEAITSTTKKTRTTKKGTENG